MIDIKKIKPRVAALARKYDLKLVLLFGSQATGKTHAKSDFDLAYLAERPLSLMDEARMSVDLTPIFKTDKIDIVNLKQESPLLTYGIFRQATLLFQKDSLMFPTRRAFAFKKYIESKPLYEARFNRLKARIKQRI